MKGSRPTKDRRIGSNNVSCSQPGGTILMTLRQLATSCNLRFFLQIDWFSIIIAGDSFLEGVFAYLSSDFCHSRCAEAFGGWPHLWALHQGQSCPENKVTHTMPSWVSFLRMVVYCYCTIKNPIQTYSN